jgi:DNA polymerase elongation subunit (family B)
LTDYGCGRHEDSRLGLQTSRRVLSGARNITELRHRRQDARRIYESRLVHIESGQVATSLLITEQVLSREFEEYDVKTRAAIAARELIGDGVNAHPGEKIGYEITNAKAKNKTEQVSASNRNGLVQYDRQEYAARLMVAAKEVGLIGDDDSSEEPGAAGASRLPLFPD